MLDSMFDSTLYTMVEQPTQHATAVPSRKYPFFIPGLSITSFDGFAPYCFRRLTRSILQKSPKFEIRQGNRPGMTRSLCRVLSRASFCIVDCMRQRIMFQETKVRLAYCLSYVVTVQQSWLIRLLCNACHLCSTFHQCSAFLLCIALLFILHFCCAPHCCCAVHSDSALHCCCAF